MAADFADAELRRH